MDKSTIEKKNLLDIIRGNRTKHLEEYVEAHAIYIAKVRDKAADLIAKINTDQEVPNIGVHFALQAPRKHLDKYDLAIRMLELDSVNEFIELDSQSFQELVLDIWDWTESFKFINSSYTSASRH